MPAILSNLFSGVLYSTFFNNKKTTVMLDILDELKYRAFYCFITVSLLVGLVYLNLGLYVEFLWSYYLDYYQFIDFCWYEGIKELNHMQFISYEAQLAKYDSRTYFSCETSNSLATEKSPLQLISDRVIGQNFASKSPGNFVPSFIQAKIENTLQKINNFILPISIEYPLNPQQIQKISSHFCYFVTEEATRESATVVVAAPQPQLQIASLVSSQKNQNILVEVDEFKQLFISILSCFSGQLRWTFDLSCGNSAYSKIQDGAKLFNICFIFIFYQVILLLVYHIFCFTTPGIFQQSRLKLLKNLQIGFVGLLLHFLTLPYIVSIAEEFAHESVDSELFFSTNFNFLSSWIYCFYLLVAIFFIVYVKIVVKN